MIVRKSSKAHPELDMSAAAKAFAAHAAEKKLTGELVTSAWNLYSVETLRERHNLRIGEAFPADVFVFGKGKDYFQRPLRGDRARSGPFGGGRAVVGHRPIRRGQAVGGMLY